MRQTGMKKKKEKKGKSPEHDRITPKIKNIGEAGKQMLMTVLNKVWKEDKDWEIGVSVPIYRKMIKEEAKIEETP